MTSRFVPTFKAPSSDVVKKFIDKVSAIDRLLVLTGAGISTESGLPDYRSEKIGLFERYNYRPVTIQEFCGFGICEKTILVSEFLSVAELLASKVQHDSLYDRLVGTIREVRLAHHSECRRPPYQLRAGSTMLSELHGCGRRVKCMQCGDITNREELQPTLEKLNAEWVRANVPGGIASDSDVVIEEGAHESFVLPSCKKCGGILKTDVVFFGDNLVQSVVSKCYEKLDECTGVLVLGSSLTVNTGSQLVDYANLQGKPVFIVNIGPTEADYIADMRISMPVTEIITKLYP